MKDNMLLDTVTIIIISDQILLGRKDLNSYKTLPESLAPKWDVLKLVVVPPKLQIVKCEVKIAFKLSEIVVIIQESANANFSVCDILANLFNEKIDTCMPLGDASITPFKLLSVRNGAAPIISFNRIFVLQGDHSALNILKLYLNDHRHNLNYRKLYQIPISDDSVEHFISDLNIDELDIKVHRSPEKYVVIAETTRASKLVCFETKMFARFEYVNIKSKPDNLNIFGSFYFQVEPHISQTVKIIEECFEKYGPSNVFLSFNGGKDCTVVLHLSLAILEKKYSDLEHNLVCLYIRSKEHPFPEQDSFIMNCKCYYNLQIMTVHDDIKKGLETVLKKYPNLKACLMGTRRTDPYSNSLKTFQMTDSDWPQVMRVSPLLDWHYSYVWDYLLYFRIPYCPLYDEGYTSLGNNINTAKNQRLSSFDIVQEEEFLPAYKLMDAKEERNGRT